MGMSSPRKTPGWSLAPIPDASLGFVERVTAGVAGRSMSACVSADLRQRQTSQSNTEPGHLAGSYARGGEATSSRQHEHGGSHGHRRSQRRIGWSDSRGRSRQRNSSAGPLQGRARLPNRMVRQFPPAAMTGENPTASRRSITPPARLGATLVQAGLTAGLADDGGTTAGETVGGRAHQPATSTTAAITNRTARAATCHQA